MDWDKATDIILLSSLLALATFAGLGLYQWLTRKSLKKVDRPLIFMLPPLALMAATYFVFDKILILNTRPDGSGEPSFPSTHVMVVATIFLLIALILPRFLNKKPLRIAIYTLMLILTILVCVGRVLANKHWPSDVMGGLVFAVIFAGIYRLLLKYYSPPPES
ncbi:phosphatase PAP2 family protein [Candidatus Saccharibacteria bacterium]|nr:phosphatase PAP2 family protein [Candidatus Saccharibacteria bacterium]